MARLLGVEVSKESIVKSQLHNVVEIVTMIAWLHYVLAGRELLGGAILIVGLTVEHILALAAGKQA